MTPDKETFSLILDLRNALAAAMRVLVKWNVAVDIFCEETQRIGVKDGIGVRADEWLKEHLPHDPPKE